MVKFKDFSRPLSFCRLIFNSNLNLIFKDFLRQSCIFKYFSSLCELWLSTSQLATDPKDFSSAPGAKQWLSLWSLTGDQRDAGVSLTACRVTALCPLPSTGSTKEDPSLHD